MAVGEFKDITLSQEMDCQKMVETMEYKPETESAISYKRKKQQAVNTVNMMRKVGDFPDNISG